ncbi:RNA-directed DNA polymerase, eukaryota, reverse transcriptase zinc-binding domain protein, partial [Tanacetum coccineum]
MACIKGALNDIVDVNQSAFIPSRQISDNILLSQELMRGYHRNRGPAKCAFKIDIEQAYDSVEWEFLANCLKHFGFHWLCKEVKLTHLCFADDMLLFCNGDSCYVVVMKKVLSVFS